MRSLRIFGQGLVTVFCWSLAILVVGLLGSAAYESVERADNAVSTAAQAIEIARAFGQMGLGFTALVVFLFIPPILFKWPYPGEKKNPP